MDQELLKRFKDGKVVFHCPTMKVFELALNAVGEFGCGVNINKSYWSSHMEFTGIDYEYRDRVSFSDLSYYRSSYPQLEIIKLSLDDFKAPSEPLTATLEVTNSTYMEALESITKTIATCKSIEKTYDIHLGIDELLEKREGLLSEWESTFEVKL